MRDNQLSLMGLGRVELPTSRLSGLIPPVQTVDCGQAIGGGIELRATRGAVPFGKPQKYLAHMQEGYAIERRGLAGSGPFGRVCTSAPNG